jgi:membrane metallo-endopeptidase-like protein 1
MDNGEEQKLPGMEYTNRQMFWMAWARTWCAKIDYGNMDRYLNDSHTPQRYRIIGPLSNEQNFAKDFGCPLGSKMNPKDKCILW